MINTVLNIITDHTVIENNNISTATNESQEIIAVETPQIEAIVTGGENVQITNSEVQNIVIQVDSVSTIVAGQPGPPGTSEDEMVYAKQTDFVSDTLIYRGDATVGSATSSPLWRIRKLDIGPDGDVSETWADGDANFNNIWDDRASLTYS